MTEPSWCFVDAEFVDRILKEQREGGLPKQGYDLRTFRCPECNAPGLNSLLGTVKHTCGFEWSSDEVWEPCAEHAQKGDQS